MTVYHFICPVADPRIIIDSFHNFCYHPKAKNLTATMGPRNDDNGNHELSLSWTSTHPDPETCNMPYCEGSQQYLVKVLGHDSVPLQRKTKPDFQTKWFRVIHNEHNKTHVFIDPRISPDKYFKFKVRNKRLSHTYTTPPTSDYTRTAKLGILYFGKQGELNLASYQVEINFFFVQSEQVL